MDRRTETSPRSRLERRDSPMSPHGERQPISTASFESLTDIARQNRTRGHSFCARSLKALPITLTEDRDIAAAAMIGESSNPKNGYKMPAAIGMPAVL